MTKSKDKLREANILIITLSILVIIFLFLLIIENHNVVELEQQLESCQEKVPVRESVLFFKCNDGVLHNIIVDGNNKSQYDYFIQKGCEVIE